MVQINLFCLSIESITYLHNSTSISSFFRQTLSTHDNFVIYRTWCNYDLISNLNMFCFSCCDSDAWLDYYFFVNGLLSYTCHVNYLVSLNHFVHFKINYFTNLSINLIGMVHKQRWNIHNHKYLINYLYRLIYCKFVMTWISLWETNSCEWLLGYVFNYKFMRNISNSAFHSRLKVKCIVSSEIGLINLVRTYLILYASGVFLTILDLQINIWTEQFITR